MTSLRCQGCGAVLRPGVDECPECGRPVFRADVKYRPNADEIERKRKEDEALFTADHERRRYELMPRQDGETVRDYYTRINRQKTPRVLAEHRKILERLNVNPTNDLKLPAVPREPGSDDAIPEVTSEQAA